MKNLKLFYLCLMMTLMSCNSAPTPKAVTAPTATPASNVATVEVKTGEVELNMIWWGSDSRHERTLKVIKLFEQEHPNIKINYQHVSIFDDYWKLAEKLAQEGNLPDIMQQDYQRIGEWIAKKRLMPLDDQKFDFSNVSAASVATGKIDGKLYGVSLGTNSLTFLIDVAAFQKAGIDLPPSNWTWHDFEEITLKLHEKLAIWGMGDSLLHSELWKSLYLSHGDWVYSKDGLQLGYSDDQIFVDYINMVLRLQKAGAIPAAEEEIALRKSATAEMKSIVMGKAAIDLFQSNQVIAAWSAAGKVRTFKLMPIPRLEGKRAANYIKPSQFFSIAANSKHPQEAAMFIDYFTNSFEANEVLMAERGVPISSVVRENLLLLLSPAQFENFTFIGQIELDNSPLPPPDPARHADIMSIYYAEFTDLILLGKMTPEEGVAQFRKKAQDILAKK